MRAILSRLKLISIFEIFVFVAITGIVIFSVKFFKSKPYERTIRIEVIKKNWTENYDPLYYRSPFWIGDKIKVGAVQKDNTGKIIAQVLSVDDFEKGNEESQVYVTVRIDTSHNLRTDQYFFQDQSLDLGSAIKLSLNNVLVVGQIIDNDYPEAGYPIKYFTATFRQKNVEPSVASHLKIGDKVLNNSTGEAIVEILSINTQQTSLPPAVIDSDNHLRIAPNRDQDLIIKAKVKAYSQNHNWYFGGNQGLKIGNTSIRLITSNVNLTGLQLEELGESVN